MTTNFFSELCGALREDEHVWLATIIGVAGSSPAPAQSRMLVRTRGGLRASGTVGGGCLDASVMYLVESNPDPDASRMMAVNLNDDAGDSGLMCGGTVRILLEPLHPTHLPVYERIADLQDRGEDCALLTFQQAGRAAAKTLFGVDGDLLCGDSVAESLRREVFALPVRQMPSGVREFTDACSSGIIEYLEASPEVIMFGAGHVGHAVAQCAALAGFRVTVVDDRPEYAAPVRFPESRRILCSDFLESFADLDISPRTFIVIATRGHRHDETILEQALTTPARYLGMIGSRRKVQIIRDRLRARGCSISDLNRLHSPVGLAIGALTPGEIAVSIVAEMIAVRRRVVADMALK